MAAFARISAKSSSISIKKFKRPLREAEVNIVFDPSQFDRKSTESLDKVIDEEWAKKTANNTHLYNGSKFRLAGYHMNESGQLVLNVGLTCYKELVGTNFRKDVLAIREEGEKQHGDADAYLAHPIGVGIVLMTSDGHVVLLRRSMWTGECAGLYDRPGGHPEPSEVPLLERNGKNGSKTPSRDEINAAIRSELFSSIAREVRDEVGIKEEFEVLLTGVTHSIDLGDRPTVDFVAQLSSTSAEVKELYAKGVHSEADESTGIWCLTPAELKTVLSLIPRLYDCKGDSVETKEMINGSNGLILEQQEVDMKERNDGEQTKLAKLVKNNMAPPLVVSLLLASDFLTGDKKLKCISAVNGNNNKVIT